MTCYCGIDLHSNNHYVCVIDENDCRVFERKLDNDARLLIACLAEFEISWTSIVMGKKNR